MELKQLVDELIASGEAKKPFAAWEKEIVERLEGEIDSYSWVGFYWLDEGELVLGAWQGPEATEHVRIAVGEGVCGRAAAEKQTVVVDDVNEEANYLACFPETKSEIVVPLFNEGELIGEIDIDGTVVGAFGDEDKAELERLADAIDKALHS